MYSSYESRYEKSRFTVCKQQWCRSACASAQYLNFTVTVYTCHILENLLQQRRARTHTHTHTHIYIYTHIYIVRHIYIYISRCTTKRALRHPGLLSANNIGADRRKIIDKQHFPHIFNSPLRYFGGVRFSGGGGGGGGGRRGGGGGYGGNFGTDVRASISKPTPFIYLAFEKTDPFIY